MPAERTDSQRNLACDGLRSIALIAVTIFHVWPARLPGGYFGVNIFLVLAGYFSSQKIYHDLTAANPHFHLLSYYRRRILRLFLPLLPMLIFTNVWTYHFQPNVFKNVYKSTASVLLSFNNIYQLLSNQSYFATHGNPQPFRHMWALSLEIQFYLLFPLLILFLWKVLGNNWHKISHALFLLASLSAVAMAARYRIGADPTPVYYAFHSRAFAFALGGAFACHHLAGTPAKKLSAGAPRKLRKLVAFLSFGSIVLTFFWADYQNPLVYFGGMFAFSMVIGIFITTLLTTDSQATRLLANPLLTTISRRSYSYYLWQYPLQVLIGDWFAFSTAPIAKRYFLLFLTLLIMGEISYRLFEQGAAILRRRSSQRLLIAVGSLVLVVININLRPLMASAPEQIPLPPPAEGLEDEPEDTQGDTVQELHIFALGDSVLGMAEDVLQYWLPNCVIDAEISRQIWQGPDILEAYLDMNANCQAIIIGLGTNGDFKENLLEQYKLLAAGRPLIFVTTVMPDNWEQSVNAKLRRFAKSQASVYIADWYKLAKEQAEWFYADGTHPKPEGVDQLVPLIIERIEAALDKL